MKPEEHDFCRHMVCRKCQVCERCEIEKKTADAAREAFQRGAEFFLGKCKGRKAVERWK